ncbi:DUF4270 family protein, partial [archaeon]
MAAQHKSQCYSYRRAFTGPKYCAFSFTIADTDDFSLSDSLPDTLSFTTEVNIKNDDIVTSNQSYLFAGAYNDPEFGDISANAYTQLILKDESRAGTYTAIDSVVMTLSYDYYYGDTTENQTINVYELTGALDKNTNYNSVSTGPGIGSTMLDQDVAFKAYPVKLQKQKI